MEFVSGVGQIDGLRTNGGNLSARKKVGESWNKSPGTKICFQNLFPQLDRSLIAEVLHIHERMKILGIPRFLGIRKNI